MGFCASESGPMAPARPCRAPVAETSSRTITTWVAPSETSSVSEPRNGFIRWYDPITGRWLSNDPIGISGGFNQYVFCANNPVNFVDPSGRTPFTNNSNHPIPYKGEKDDFKPPSIAQPGQTVDADGVYSPNGAQNPSVIKLPDNVKATLGEDGQLTVEINGVGGAIKTLGGKLLGKETAPRQLTPNDLSSEPFRNWPDPYSGRQWPYDQWDKPKPKCP
jgi:uncharacterized protein RhaS with RHS repeats